MSILVLGAGELGMQVIKATVRYKAVQEHTTSLAVVLRPVSSSSSKDASEIEALGCSIIRHDVAASDIDDLARIFADYDAVVSCLGYAAGPGVQLNITRAVLKARVKRFFPWQFGVDYDAIGRGSGQTLFDEQLDVRELLRAQTDVDWVIVTTGVFMSFVFESFFGVVEGVKDFGAEAITVRALGAWDNGLSVTAVEDIGTLTAAILFDETVKQEVIYTSGDTFSYRQLSDVVGNVMRKPIKTELWTRDHLATELTKDPKDTVRKYRVAFAAGKGVLWDKKKTYNARKNIATYDVKRWLEENILPQKK